MRRAEQLHEEILAQMDLSKEASDEELLHTVTKHPEMFDRLIEWEKEDNIFHRRLTRRETPSEIKARLMSKPQPGLSSNKNQG